MPPQRRKSFRATVSEAMRYFASGNVPPSMIPSWLAKLREAASRVLPTDEETHAKIQRILTTYFETMMKPAKISGLVPGVKEYTIAMVKPELRAELDRKIRQSADLIKLRREEAINRTLARFQGWMTSIPVTGATQESVTKAKEGILKPTAQEKYEWRRVTIDQGHKLSANIAAVIAIQNGAIAGVWRSHWRDPSYNYRPDHKARDQKTYAIRNNWAVQQGLMKAGPNGYLDEITQPGEEVYCRCWVRYIHDISELPEDMLTAKGKKELSL